MADVQDQNASHSEPPKDGLPPAGGGGSGWRLFAVWAFGFLALAALILVVLHIGEIQRFVELARSARPKWLLLALLAQVVTYVCAAAVWHRALKQVGHPRPLASLVPLGLAKLFTDQALPSGGVSGTVLVMRGLARRNIPARAAMAALLVGLVSFYSAYLAVVLLSFGVLWLHHQVNPALLAGVALFAIVAVAIPALVLWLRRWTNRPAPAWLTRLPGVTALLDAVAQAPTAPLRSPRLLGETFVLQFSVFLLDALTLWLAFLALGAPADFWVVFVSFVMASVAATLGPMPLGLGTFEVGSVGMLSLLGVPVEAALTATLLLRGLTFWLPMLPGLWLARQELKASRKV